ncbi:MAG: hypothetical protein SFZ23_04615 [Planctomycetota bacterium]|nr:hypothetical protein [Planctomycetota bacterium]
MPSIGFAGFQADLAILNCGAGDSVLDITRPAPFAFAPQTLVASRFGCTLKLDDARDTLPPNMGTRGINPGQAIARFSPNFSRDNPAVALTFTLVVDDQPGVRSFRIDPNGPSNGGWTRDDLRWIRYYTDEDGRQGAARNNVAFAAQVVVVPTPSGAALLLAITGVPSMYRRRIIRL